MKKDDKKNENKPVDIKARERDLAFGILLVFICIALIVYSHRMNIQAMEIANAFYYTAPGFLILILAIGILLMAIYLIVNSIREGATLKWLLPRNLAKRFKEGKALQTFLVFLYLFIYMVFLWGNIPYTRIRVPFWLNTMIFMNLIMFTFKVTKPWKIVVISIITSFTVYFIFSSLIHVPLP